MFIQAVPSQPYSLFEKELSVPYLLGDLEVWLDPRIDIGWSTNIRGQGNLVNLGTATVGTIAVTYDTTRQLVAETTFGTCTTSGITSINDQENQTVIMITQFSGTYRTGTDTILQVGPLGMNIYWPQNEIGAIVFDGCDSILEESLNRDLDLKTAPAMYATRTTQRADAYVNSEMYYPATQYEPVSGYVLDDNAASQGIKWGTETNEFYAGAILKYNKALTNGEIDSIYSWYQENFYPDLATA